MLLNMEPFTVFMENQERTYIDELYSEDNSRCREALVCLKNAVIGSNKQKGIVIYQGVVSKLVQLLGDESKPLNIRMECAIVIGSLAKGLKEHVESLIKFDASLVLIKIIKNNNEDRKFLEICLCALKTIFICTETAPVDLINEEFLTRLINLASEESAGFECPVTTQACIANIFEIISNTSKEKINLIQFIPFLTRLMMSHLKILQFPALKCLASLCFTNRTVSDFVCANSIMMDTLVVLSSRCQDAEIQLSASRCFTYIHRSGSINANDDRLIYKTIPCLARLCSKDYEMNIRAVAAETLAYLAEIDSYLQSLASISNHLINSLANLVRTPKPMARQGAFRAFASLAANDEDIRKKIIEMDGLMEEVLRGLKDASPEVRLAAVRCLHSLSRSVQLLRTTFQDHSVWRPLMDLLSVNGEPSSELLTVVTSTICNLLLEFSPAKEPMLESGAVEMLCELTKHSDVALRLNGSWALMNMAFQAEQHVKTKILSALGTDRIFILLCDSDTRVIMKTLGLLRNLLSNTLHIENIMTEHSGSIMNSVNLVLDSNHPAEVKEQALCILGNIGAGARDRDYILEDESLLVKLLEFLIHKDPKLQAGSLFAIGNLLHQSGRQKKLKELGILHHLEKLLNMTPRESQFYEDIHQVIRRFNIEDD